MCCINQKTHIAQYKQRVIFYFWEMLDYLLKPLVTFARYHFYPPYGLWRDVDHTNNGDSNRIDSGYTKVHAVMFSYPVTFPEPLDVTATNVTM